VTNTSGESAGILYVVATPIGNAADLGERAREILVSADLIAAEDTRRAARLLAAAGSDRPLLSLHEHNEESMLERLVGELGQGRRVALVSDAGTPLISDPGLKLVQAAGRAGHAIVPVPGPSAVTAALSAAGLPTDRFVFEGFLPRREGARRERLTALENEPRTMVFFEAVHRIRSTLDAMIEVFGATRPAVLARELTKTHEQLVRGSLAELGAGLGKAIPLLGEFVVLVAGAPGVVASADAEVVRLYGLLAAELAPARAVALVAEISGRSRNEVYALTRAAGLSARHPSG